MKIAILNRVFLTEKHLYELQNLGEVVIFNDTDNEEKAIERLRDVEIAIVDGFVCPLNANVLEQNGSLKFVTLGATGFDCIDIETAREKGITISNIPAYSSQAVAELTVALMFSVARKIPYGDRKIRQKYFEIDPSYDLRNDFIGFNLEGKTLGIVGYGDIGSRVAKLAHGIGMDVLAFTRNPRDDEGVEFMGFDSLLKKSDVVSIHLPLNDQTKNFFSNRQFELMKTESILINTARGGIVDTEALYKALATRQIWGAGLDVIDAPADHLIFHLNNIVTTPHLAFFTEEALKKLADTIVLNVKSFISGNPINLVY